MTSKRKRDASAVTNPLRRVPMTAIAQVGTRLQNNPEVLQQSQHYSAYRREERKTHDKLYEKWNVQKVQLELAKGRTLAWHLPNLSQILEWHYENNTMFRDALAAVVKGNPNKPVHLIPYSDEYTPGNVLHPEVRNKNLRLVLLRDGIWASVVERMSVDTSRGNTFIKYEEPGRKVFLRP